MKRIITRGTTQAGKQVLMAAVTSTRSKYAKSITRKTHRNAKSNLPKRHVLVLANRSSLAVWITQLRKDLRETEVLLEQCSDRYN